MLEVTQQRHNDCSTSFILFSSLEAKNESYIPIIIFNYCLIIFCFQMQGEPETSDNRFINDSHDEIRKIVEMCSQITNDTNRHH